MKNTVVTAAHHEHSRMALVVVGGPEDVGSTNSEPESRQAFRARIQSFLIQYDGTAKPVNLREKGSGKCLVDRVGKP
jgi:hypothetical protein